MTEDRPPLAGRFAILRPLEQSSDRFFGTDSSLGKRVVIALVDAGRMSSLEPARGIKHRHLAGIVEIVRDPNPAELPPATPLPAGTAAVVAEHVPGRTLYAQLATGKLHPARAVAWALRLAEALQTVHQSGAVHGAISPRSVIGEPAGRAIAPVLAQLVAPPVGAFCPPERLKGAAEAASDDVFALYATLYAALTGEAPFRALSREALLKAVLSKPKPLSAFGLNEPALQEILQRGLLPDRHARAGDLADLVEALDGWERDPSKVPPRRAPAPRPGLRGLGDIVGGTLASNRDDGIVVDDDQLPDDQGVDLPEASSPQAVVVPLPGPPQRSPEPQDDDPTTIFRAPEELLAKLAQQREALVADRESPVMPPPDAPTPASDGPEAPVVASPAPAPPPKKRFSINPFERQRVLWPWLVAAALFGGGAVYLAVAPAAAPPPKVQAAPPPPPPPKPKAAPAIRKDPAEVRDACVAAHFPKEALEGSPSFAFVCEEADFLQQTRRLHDMLKPPAPEDAGADAGAVDGGKAPPPRGLGLDWYELPATAIIRKTCCPGSAPAALPETTGWCEQLESVVQRIAENSQRAVDLAPGARAFDKAVTCLFANKIPHGYTYEKMPTPANRQAFQQFLSRAAVIGARR